MIDILKNKNLATRFQILVEIAHSGPNIQQQDIAKKLYVTPQAISDYTRQLIEEGLLVSEGRSKYRLTNEGVNCVIRTLRELREYDTLIERAITNISVCAAIADSDLIAGQKVGLEMKNGILYATTNVNSGAQGIATTAARAGEDVGVSDIEGIVPLKMSNVSILKIPGIEQGGSRTVAIEELRRQIGDREPIGAIGIEAIVALRKLSLSNIYVYGVTEAAIEAIRSGLSPVIICVDSEIPVLTRKLGEENIDYQIVDVKNT